MSKELLFTEQRRKLRLFWNRHRTFFQIQRKGKFFTLVIHERFRKSVRWFKYILALVGIISGLFVFPNFIYAILFGVSLFLIQSFVEKTIFSYHVLVVMPFPDFEIEGKKWLGVLSGYAAAPTQKIPVLGMVFNDEDYARKIYKYVLNWNYGNLKDPDNNIVISIVTNETSDKYVLYLYANPDRETAKQIFEQNEKERKNNAETFTDILIKNYIMLTLGKTCIVSPQSYLPILLKTYSDGSPYYFVFHYSKNDTPDGNPTSKVSGTNDIIKINLKIRKESQLTRKDMEYEMRRNWHPDDSEFLGPKHLLHH